MGRRNNRKIVGTPQAAALLEVSGQRIRQLAATGELPGVKIGQNWVFALETIESFERKPRGRPAALALSQYLAVPDNDELTP